jgi:hypothetical protein
MEAWKQVSEVDVIPAPFNLVFNVFLKPIIGPCGYEDLVFNRYAEIWNIKVK